MRIGWIELLGLGIVNERDASPIRLACIDGRDTAKLFFNTDHWAFTHRDLT